MSETPYLSTAEAADRIGVRRAWIWRLIQRGDLPAVRVGRYWAVRAEDVDAYRATARPVGRPAKPEMEPR